MPLSLGSQLGAYEILGTLGAGGMGEVYRAHDTRLRRDVAIKVVLESFIAERDRLARFEREARALAALNHPNIATLHGMEVSDGRHFLVMELVEGPTLQDVISNVGKNGLPIERVLSIARQIAEALEAAHEKGIVHRDLKPANVKISTDDKVKVLDFGLAKASDQTQGSGLKAQGDVSQSPTMTSPAMTQAGMILGTASYMSPEQARGLSGDHRSDIFSFGVVLYEMLTGSQPFQGDTVSDVLASVLAREPDLASLPPDLAPRLSDLVKRCLEKHPKRRWQAIGDLRHELEVIAENPRKLEAPVTGARPAALPKPLWRRAVPVTVAALLAAAATAGAFLATRQPPPAPAVSRFAVLYPEGHPRTVNIRTALAISPDGTRVAYVANRDIYIRTLSDLEPRLLPRSDAPNLASTPMSLVFSPDGSALAYWDLGDQRIKRIDLAGGAPFVVAVAGNPNGMTWHGDHLYFTATDGIRRVPASGGESELVITTEPMMKTAPQILDDGRLLYSKAPPGDASAERWSAASIVVQRPGEASPTTLVEGGSDPRYLPSGHLVYQSAGTLIARRYDPQTGTLGSPAAVVDGVLRGSVPLSAGAAWYGVSATGTLIYVPGPVGNARTEFRFAWFDRAGKEEPLPIPAGEYAHPRVSRDGKRVAFGRADDNDTSIWVYDFGAGGSPRRLTFGGRDRFPIWSGDSQWVIFQSNRDGDVSLYRQRADGSGAAERLTTAPKGAMDVPETAAPDGRVLLFNRVTQTGTSGGSALMAYSYTDRTAAPYRDIVSAFKGGAEFSPDGKWLVYAVASPGARAGGTFSSIIPYVEPYPATGTKHQIATAREGGHSPVWSADGREVYYTPGPGAVLQAIRITTSPSFSFSPAEPAVRPFSNSPAGVGRMFDVAPASAGGRFLGFVPTFISDSSAPKRDEIRIVLNWTEELKAKVR